MIVTISVLLFAVCMLIPFDFGSYFVCMLLPIGYIMLTIHAKTKADQWLKYLMMIHGIFFFGCFLMPMTGIFRSMADGETNIGGVIALEFWCAYFTPVGILSILHFRKAETIY